MPPLAPKPLFAAALCAALSFACATTGGNFVWVDQYEPVTASSPQYVIAPGDVLLVRVWNQDAMTSRVKVRDDGRITLPFLGDVEAAGYQPTVLAEQLHTRMKDLFVNPAVTVGVEEARAVQVSVAGEVARAGVYPLSPAGTVLEALTAAGGLTEYANPDAIYVLRPRGGTVDRVRLTWKALTRADGKAALFRLQRGDAIVVE